MFGLRALLLVLLVAALLPWGPYLATTAAPLPANVAASDVPALQPAGHRCRTAPLPGAACWSDRLLPDEAAAPAPGIRAAVTRPEDVPLGSGRAPEAPRGPPRRG